MNAKALSLLATVSLLSSATVASAFPVAQRTARTESSRLVQDAPAASPSLSKRYYQLAVWLDRTNEPAQLGLAREQIAAGEPDAALVTLQNTLPGSTAEELRIHTLLELGRNAEAANRSSALLSGKPSDDQIILISLAYAQTGRSAEIPALIPLVSSPEASQRIGRVSAGQLPLATELIVSGLPESSKALLLKLPTNFERNLLLARLALQENTPASLSAATDYLETATSLNPANAEAHSLLARVYANRNMPAAGAAQAKLLQELQNGRP